MSKFSATRLADLATAESGNANLQPAIQWLRTHTDAGRLTELELYEILATAAAGPFVIKYNTNTVP